MKTLQILNITIQIWGMMFALMALWGVNTVLDIRQKNVRSLIALVCADILLLIFDVCAWIFDGNTTQMGYFMVRICNWGLFLSNFCMLCLINLHIYERIDHSGDRLTQWMENLVFFVSGIGIVLVCISQVSQIIYGFDQNNVYFRGEFFWMTQVLSILGLMFLAMIVFRNRTQLQRQEYGIYLLCFGLISGALIVQIFVYGTALLNIIETVSVLLIVFYNMVEKVQERSWRPGCRSKSLSRPTRN